MNLRQVYEALLVRHDAITIRQGNWSPLFSVEQAGLKMGLEEAITLLEPIIEGMDKAEVSYGNSPYAFPFARYLSK